MSLKGKALNLTEQQQKELDEYIDQRLESDEVKALQAMMERIKLLFQDEEQVKDVLRHIGSIEPEEENLAYTLHPDTKK